MEEKYYTLNQVSEITQIKLSTLRSYVYKGLLPITKIQGNVRVSSSDLQEFINGSKKGESKK